LGLVVHKKAGALRRGCCGRSNDCGTRTPSCHISQIASHLSALHYRTHSIFAGKNNPIEFFQSIKRCVHRTKVLWRREGYQRQQNWYGAQLVKVLDQFNTLARRARYDNSFTR
jgi:hypothetical protein